MSMERGGRGYVASSRSDYPISRGLDSPFRKPCVYRMYVRGKGYRYRCFGSLRAKFDIRHTWLQGFA